MRQRCSCFERIVTVEHCTQINYLGRVIHDPRTSGDPYEWVPNTTIFEDEQDIVILAELAGLTTEQTIVIVDGDRLIIRGERVLPVKRPISSYYQIEISMGRFQKVIRFREAIDSESVQTTMNNGLMEIRVPKSAFSAG